MTSSNPFNLLTAFGLFRLSLIFAFKSPLDHVAPGLRSALGALLEMGRCVVSSRVMNNGTYIAEDGLEQRVLAFAAIHSGVDLRKLTPMTRLAQDPRHQGR